jgi:hypothetical protein
MAPTASAHLSDELFVSYVTGRAPADTEEKVEEHLEHCAACSGRLVQFYERLAEAHPLSEGEWSKERESRLAGRIRGRMATFDRAHQHPPAPVPGPAPSPRWRRHVAAWRFPLAAAATAVLLSVLIDRTRPVEPAPDPGRGQPTAPTPGPASPAPAASPPPTTAGAGRPPSGRGPESQRGPGAAVMIETVRVGRDGDRVRVAVRLGEQAPYPSYSLDVETIDGEVLAAGAAGPPRLEGERERWVTVEVPPERLGPGTYLAVLRGWRADRRGEPLAERPFTVDR